ncbi:EamA domain-containing protein, variant 2 [Balamuthia mandrillaris]
MEQQAGGGLTRWEWWRGVAIAAVVVSLVVGVAELGQYLQTSLGFDKAYFLVYVNTTFVSSLLWIEFLRFLVLDRRQRRGQEEGRGRRGFLMLLGSGMEEDTPVNESNDEDVEVRKTLSSRKEKAEEEKSKLLPSSPQIQEEQAGDEGNDKTFRGAGAAFSALRGVWERFLAHVVAATDGVSLKRLALAAIPLTVFWWLANYCYTLSLPLTSVASILSIEQASTIFVYILSVIFLREKITLIKVMAVVVCIGGVVLIAFGDDEGSKHDSSSSSSASSSETKQKPLLGDIIVVFSAIGGACYMVFYKRVLCSGGGGGLGLPAVNVLLGCVGLCNALFAWPGLVWFFVSFALYGVCSSKTSHADNSELHGMGAIRAANISIHSARCPGQSLPLRDVQLPAELRHSGNVTAVHAHSHHVLRASQLSGAVDPLPRGASPFGAELDTAAGRVIGVGWLCGFLCCEPTNFAAGRRGADNDNDDDEWIDGQARRERWGDRRGDCGCAGRQMKVKHCVRFSVSMTCTEICTSCQG